MHIMSKLNSFFKKFKIYIKPFLHWKFLIAFGLAWLITNGWCYVAFGFAVWLNISWLKSIAVGYMTFLYFPFTAEKLITIPLAIYFQMKLFPNDEKLHVDLSKMEYQAFLDSYKYLKVFWERIWLKRQYSGKRIKKAISLF